MKVLVIPFLLACMAGCVTTRAELVGTTTYAPNPHDHPIALFVSMDDVGQPFVKVAVIHGEGDPAVSWSEVLNGMKAKARSVGADALVLGDEHTEVAGITQYGVSHRKHKNAIAIRFVPE